MRQIIPIAVSHKPIHGYLWDAMKQAGFRQSESHPDYFFHTELPYVCGLEGLGTRIIFFATDQFEWAELFAFTLPDTKKQFLAILNAYMP